MLELLASSYASSIISTFFDNSYNKVYPPNLSNVAIKIVNNCLIVIMPLEAATFVTVTWLNLTHRGSLRRLQWYSNFKSSLGPIIGRAICNSLAQIKVCIPK